MRLLLFFTKESKEYYSIVRSALTEAFSFLNPTKPREAELRSAWFNEATNQYEVNKILEEFKKFEQPFLFTIMKDLYTPGLNFIFGKATPYSGAVLSLNRLKTENTELFEERVKKETKHEVAHIFGLSHCNSNCVMQFSNSLEEVDQKAGEFCMSCKRKLKNFRE